MNNDYIISKELAHKILDYLVRRPMIEVMDLVNDLNKIKALEKN